MPNVEDVQRHLTDNINAITWAGLEVRERLIILKLLKNEPKKEKEQRPQNLVAKRSDYYKNVCRSWKAGCTEK